MINGKTAWWLTAERTDGQLKNPAAIPMHMCDVPHNAQAFTDNPFAAFTWTKRADLDLVDICVLPKELRT